MRPSRADTRADGINESAGLQSFLNWCAGCVAVGWYYVPQTSYELSGVQTRFSNDTDGPGLTDRTVTVEVLTERRAVGGTLLASATFDSSIARSQLGGGTFATPVGLVAGSRYFIGFRNVQGIGINTTNDAGATNLGGLGLFLDGDGVNDGRYKTRGGLPSTGSAQDQPILRFMEPDTPTGVSPSPGQALALAVKKAAFAFKTAVLSDSFKFVGSVPFSHGAIDPTKGFALLVVKDDSSVIGGIDIPADDPTWKTTSKPSWKLKKSEAGTVESVLVKLNRKAARYDIKVKIAKTDFTSPGAGTYTAIANIGAGVSVEMNRQPWRALKHGAKLVSP